MKALILIALKQKYPNVSAKFLGLWADKLAQKATEESQIEGVINELDNLPISISDLATEFQKEGDRRVATFEKQKPVVKEKKEGEAEPADDPTMPTWAKAILEQNKTLATQLQTIQAEKQTGTIREKASSALKDVPALFWNKRALPGKDEELDAFIADVQADYKELTKDTTPAANPIGWTPKPVTGTTGDTGKGVSADMKAYVESKKASEQAASK